MSIKRLLFLLLGFCLIGCEDRINDVPSYPVYMDLDMVAMYPHFVPDNGFQTMVFTQKRYEHELIGFAGVLVWIGMDGHYYAADLCCPYCVNREQPVEPDGIFAVCPECGEAYDLSYGLANPTRGTAKHPLRRFGTRLSGSILQLRN